jgi:hypothetical protein
VTHRASAQPEFRTGGRRRYNVGDIAKECGSPDEFLPGLPQLLSYRARKTHLQSATDLIRRPQKLFAINVQ